MTTVINDVFRFFEVFRRQGWGGVQRRLGNRLFVPGHWQGYTHEAMIFASWMDFSPDDVIASQAIHAAYPGDLDIHSITWFLPEFQHPYFGGIYTLLRFADYLKREKGINHQFKILGTVKPEIISERIAQVYPALAHEPISTFGHRKHVAAFEPTDIGIATLWATAYFLLRFNQTKRKFYFMQDYEPIFYPAGSIYGQVEATYRFGFYGIANTPAIQGIYEKQYGGQAECFVPCVDTKLFFPDQKNLDEPSDPVEIFFYGRPGHPRNGFELGAQALRILKEDLGEKIHIVAAGGIWDPFDFGLDGVVENLGLLSFEQTADLYRRCQVGLTMMFTRHPSYLPFELMASGCLVVGTYNPATSWLFQDGQNCLLTQPSATCLAETLTRAILDIPQRQRMVRFALDQILTGYSDWNGEIEKIYRYMRSAERQSIVF